MENKYTVVQVSKARNTEGEWHSHTILCTAGKTFKTEAAAKGFITKNAMQAVVNPLGDGGIERLEWLPATLKVDPVEERTYAVVENSGIPVYFM